MEAKLKRLLSDLKLNENTISTVFGIFILVAIGYFGIAYIRNAPVDLPKLETDNIAVETEQPVQINSELALAPDTQTEQDPNKLQIPTIIPITASPTETPQVNTPTPLPTDTPEPTVTPAGEITSGVSTSRQAQPTPTTNTAPTSETYTVKAGDSLWKISETLFQTGYAWTEIAQANNIANPSAIESGTTLAIPQLARAYPATVAGANTEVGGTYDQKAPAYDQTQTESNNDTTAPNTTQHTVQAGETLWSIAQINYQDGFQWTIIAQANQISDPRTIEIGQVLTIPPAQ